MTQDQYNELLKAVGALQTATMKHQQAYLDMPANPVSALLWKTCCPLINEIQNLTKALIRTGP